MIEKVSAIDLLCTRVLLLDSPCPDGFPEQACREIRKGYSEAMARLKEANPECLPCDEGKIIHRFKELAKRSLLR